MSMSVCLSVCPQVHLKNHHASNNLTMLHIVRGRMALSYFGGVAAMFIRTSSFVDDVTYVFM